MPILVGASGSNTFGGTPTYSYLQSGRVVNVANGFNSVSAYAAAGSNAVAYMVGAGSGTNTFGGTSTYSYLQGTGYSNVVNGFSLVVAYAAAGSTNNAYIVGGAGAAIAFMARPAIATSRAAAT